MGLSGGNCSCKADDIFAPLKGKMKVLKKIKRRMGLAPRHTASCPGPNNLPPLQFHTVHGDNIRISRDGATARRHESFCKGVTFSARPVRVNERVYVKFSEISNNWSGVIRLGFTCNDPATLRHGLPKYACPDLTNKPGYWAKALAERFCEKDNILFFYVTSTGDVHFGINGEEKGLFFSGVETRGPLWTLIDVYGNCTAIEFLDSRIQMSAVARRSTPDVEVDRVIPSLQALSVQEEMPAPRFTAPAQTMTPVPFHRTRGRNVRLSADRCIASRADTEFCQGYVFTARPLLIGERLIVQVLATEQMYVGALALGLTSCDPNTLQPSDLPDDSDMLLDRPEYWVVSKDIASSPQRGDELCFCVTASGEVQISKNGGHASVVMHVDQSLKLWAFLDVYGSTQSIRVMSIPPTPSPQRLRVSLPTGSESMNSINSQTEQRRTLPTATSRIISVPSGGDLVQLQPSANGGAVLVVNLPPTSMLGGNSVGPVSHHSAMPVGSSATILSNYSNTYVEPVATSYSRLDGAGAGPFAGEECTICYENSIDCVLYMCGHMCMCYECAIQQWRGKGGGHCPLCRAVIRDVIRTYKSC